MGKLFEDFMVFMSGDTPPSLKGLDMGGSFSGLMYSLQSYSLK